MRGEAFLQLIAKPLVAAPLPSRAANPGCERPALPGPFGGHQLQAASGCLPSGYSQRGSSAIEFAFCSLILIPLLLGGLSVGFNLVRATEVAQFARDAGHLYSYGIDFTQSSAQQMLVTLSTGLNFALSGGTGEVIFGTVLMVGPNDCTSGGLQANTASCPNLNQTVYTRWYKVGNTSLYTSSLGTPATADSTTGIISSSSYLRDSSARASGVSSLITLAAGQSMYLTEVYFSSSDYNITGFLTGSGVYARAIF